MGRLRPGIDPRKVLSHHRERGPKRFQFTYADIAEALEMTEAAVRKAASRGRFDPGNLESLLEFCIEKYSKPKAEGPSMRSLIEEARALTGLEEDEDES